MKIAIVCDDLIQFGGQERLVLALSDIWPNAPVYSSYISKKWQKILADKDRKYVTSFMQNLPFVEVFNRNYSVFLAHILAFESFDFSEYDVVLSISSRYAHHVITKPTTKHVCYMNSPGRMFWESADYFAEEDLKKSRLTKRLFECFIAFPLNILRMLDYVAAQRVDVFIANSRTPQERIKKYYQRDSEVAYPFADLDRFKVAKTFSEADYFMVVTRLAQWKRVDIAVQACRRLGLKLKVVGDGPALGDLKKIADKNVEILGWLDDTAVAKLYAESLAIINTQCEDFGICPLEAMASGKPVIAYGKGGALETVLAGITGEFFAKQTPESLMEVLKQFNSSKYNPEKCRNQAEKFSRKVFEQSIKKVCGWN